MTIKVKDILAQRLLDENEIFNFLGLNRNASKETMTEVINDLKHIFGSDDNKVKYDELIKKINFVEEVTTTMQFHCES